MMSRSFVVLCSVLCLMGLAVSLQAQTILNGNFEDGGRYWSFRRGWELDCSRARTGDCSAKYQTDRSKYTPIARQKFHIDRSGFCELTVWIKTMLEDEPFWSDGEPTRTGVSVQLWNRTGRGALVPLDLARQNVYRKGYRGQGGEQGWRKYEGRTSMAAGNWEVRLYMHPVRSRIDGQLRKIANAKGVTWVDDVKLIRID